MLLEFLQILLHPSEVILESSEYFTLIMLDYSCYFFVESIQIAVELVMVLPNFILEGDGLLGDESAAVLVGRTQRGQLLQGDVA
jgi:hypothetical protein